MIESILDPRHIRFTRMICAGTGDPDFPSQRLGSGFVVFYRKKFFCITAKHVIENQKAEPDLVWIPFTMFGEFHDWWSASFGIAVAAEEFDGDALFADQAVFLMEAPEPQWGPLDQFEYLVPSESILFFKGMPLFAFGYPDGSNALDCQSQNIDGTLEVVSGEYFGETASLGIHRLKSPDLKMRECNGFSGGPVTTLDPLRIGRHTLVGMVIQGGGGSDLLHFIDIGKLTHFLAFAYSKLCTGD